MFFNINNDFCRPFPYISMNCLNKFLDFTCKNASWRSLSIILGKLTFFILSVLHRHSSDGSNCIVNVTAQKMKFSITDFFSKCDQIRSFLKKSVMENFIFCAVLCINQCNLCIINLMRIIQNFSKETLFYFLIVTCFILILFAGNLLSNFL